MKLNSKIISASILIYLSIATGCQTITIEPKPGGRSVIAVVGEINNIDNPCISIVLVNHLFQGGGYVPLNNATATISCKDVVWPMTRDELNNIWIGGGCGEPGDRYHLKIDTPVGDVFGEAQIPHEFNVNYSYDGENRFIELNGEESPSICQHENAPEFSRYFIVEVEEQDISGGVRPVPFKCIDEFTDNYKYNELSIPFEKLFVRWDNKTLNIKLTPLVAINPNSSYSIVVRSAIPCYYKYLYNCEVQKESFIKQIELKGNIHGGIGVFGAAYKVIKPLSLVK